MKKLTPFKRWSDIIKKNNICKTPTTNRFIARYKFAKKFTHIEANGFSKKTLRGYSALMSVFFAYTAFEALVEAVAENKLRDDNIFSVEFHIDKHNHPFNDIDIAERILSNEKLLQILIDYADVSQANSLQIEKLMSFYLGEISGKYLHSVTKQIRHLIAHGHLTAYGANANRKNNIDTLFDLSELVLSEVYDLFDTYVSEISNSIALISSNSR